MSARTMTRAIARCLIALALLAGAIHTPTAIAGPFRIMGGVPINLKGELIDLTNENGKDNRIWSDTLGAYRNLYIYLPPDYDPAKPSKVMFWFHAFLQETSWFAKNSLSEIDAKMAAGELPSVVLVFPDGSPASKRRRLSFPAATMFMDSELGNYETHVMEEVWPLVHERYNLSNRKEDHIFAGASMGGGSAMRMAIRYRDRVGAGISVFGPLDLRYQDHHGRYLGNIPLEVPRSNFNRPKLPVARFGLVVPVYLSQFAEPLFNLRDPNVASQIAAQNPKDMLDDLNVQPGELSVFVGYGRYDEYNFDSQGKAFANRARELGLQTEEVEDRWGHHTVRTANHILPCALDFIRRYFSENEPTP